MSDKDDFEYRLGGWNPAIDGPQERRQFRYRWLYMRSQCEVTLAQLLDQRNINWLYEPKRFDLGEGITYLPDFYLTDYIAWIETKGYMDPESRVKCDRFQERQEEFGPLCIIMCDSNMGQTLETFLEQLRKARRE